MYVYLQKVFQVDLRGVPYILYIYIFMYILYIHRYTDTYRYGYTVYI